MPSPTGQRFEIFWHQNQEKFSTDKVAILGSEEPLNYNCLRDIKSCNFFSNQKDCLKEAKKLGFRIETSINKKFDTVILELTKNTDHNLSLFAMAEESLNLKGVLVLNGDNNLGIQSLIKKINFHWRHKDLFVKGRGRIAFFVKERNLSIQIKHWKHLSKLKINKDGYYTSPEMFSPKQIDQGSIKLAKVLKNSLNGKVADLGSGCYLRNESIPTLTNVDFISNIAANSGGGILLKDNADAIMTNIKVVSNIAEGLGGGIYLNNADPSIDYALVALNAGSAGGGIYIRNNSDPIFNHMTVAYNSSGFDDSGVADLFTRLLKFRPTRQRQL